MLVFFLLLVSAVWINRTLQLLKSLKKMPRVAPVPFSNGGSPELVSVIVPMKNEAVNAAACVARLKTQDYPNLQILIADDNSTDGTGKILEDAGIAAVNVPPTPEGWTGKNFAIHTAVAQARGQWLLFTDADTRHEKTSVSSALRHVQTHGLQFLTLLPRCLAEGFLENMIQPAAMVYLGLWFPIQKINDPRSPVYFGNGQYLLIERGLYETIGGHAAVRQEFLEDFAFMKHAKELKVNAECALGKDIYGTRMYDSFGSIWRGWRRIFLHAFQRRPLRLLLHAFSAIFFTAAPLVILVLALTGSQPLWLTSAACALQLLIMGICWKSYEIIEGRKAFLFLHPPAALILSLILADAAWIAATRQKTVWR